MKSSSISVVIVIFPYDLMTFSLIKRANRCWYICDGMADKSLLIFILLKLFQSLSTFLEVFHSCR